MADADRLGVRVTDAVPRRRAEVRSVTFTPLRLDRSIAPLHWLSRLGLASMLPAAGAVSTHHRPRVSQPLDAYETPIDKMLSLPPQRGRLETRAG